MENETSTLVIHLQVPNINSVESVNLNIMIVIKVYHGHYSSTKKYYKFHIKQTT